MLSGGRIGVREEWLTPQTEDQHPDSGRCPCCHPASSPGSWLCLPLVAVATTLGGACTLSSILSQGMLGIHASWTRVLQVLRETIVTPPLGTATIYGGGEFIS